MTNRKRPPYQPRPRSSRPCAFCGALMENVTARRVYCSDNCRARASERKRRRYDRPGRPRKTEHNADTDQT